jgi:Na+/proline symporter
VLYLPALALATVSSLDTSVCIVGMGLLTIAITAFGGMEAVIWTDVAQTIILLLAALLSLVVILLHLDGGLLQHAALAIEHGKVFPDIPWTAAWTIESGWVIVLGTLFSSLISYTSNQEVVQRYMSTQDERGAARAIWMNALLSVPAGALFFAVGTALFLFYQQLPARLDPGLSRNDAIFPYFMVWELPVGVAGFVVAGIFAAAQPTSGLNSVAAAVVTDFYQRTRPQATSQSLVRVGRFTTVVTGVLGVAVALIMNHYPVQSLWEFFLNTLGLTTGILAGLFSLGILTRRGTAAGALLGIAAAAVTLWATATYGQIHPLMYGCVAVVSSFAGGYLFSLLGPRSTKNLSRLTIHTAGAPFRLNALASVGARQSL